MGSDGVVRAAAANLNSAYIRLEQQVVADGKEVALEIKEIKTTAPTAFTLVKGKAHSGDKIGIMRSVKANSDTHETLSAILKCIKVNTINDYKTVCEDFDKQVVAVQQDELVEADLNILLPDKYFINDPKSMVIVKVMDEDGRDIGECDIIFMGPDNDPNKLPHGFMADRQRNSIGKGTVTFFFNYTAMAGGPEVKYGDKILRAKKEGVKKLGLLIDPHNNSGFAHYAKAKINASEEQLKTILRANQTTLIEIVMKRVVHEGAFRITQNRVAEEFKDTDTGKIIS